MPKTKGKPVSRKPVRIPTPMLQEIERIIKDHKEMSYNRQQFIESAIREKIMRIKLMETKVTVQP